VPVPRCYNALVRARAKDYLDSIGFVSTDQDNELTLGMQPTISIDKVNMV